MRFAILLTLFALMLMQGCAHQDKWTSRDTVLQVGVTVAIMADAYTTSKIQYHGGYERNPIGRKLLGRQPGTKETYLYLSTWAISNYFISRMLPKEWRPYWQGVTFGAHVQAVIGNCHAGLCP